MLKFFNTAGPCESADHYMLPPERRLPEVRRLIDRKLYFVVHAPRQTGKTTAFQAVIRTLLAEGRYTALLTTCETGHVAGSDVDRGIDAILRAIETQAETLPEELRPEPLASVADIPGESRLWRYLSRWCQRSPRPVVLFLDEIDALLDETLLAVLRQLRAGYSNRPGRFPWSVALIGLRDVRDYRIHLRPETASLGTASPFNIKAASLTLRNFTAAEIVELYGQHTAATGQAFTPEATALVFELTRGQPWLVNVLAHEAVEVLVPDVAQAVTAEIIEQAKENIVLRRDTHVDSLIDRLREQRVQRVLEPIVAGELMAADVLDDDVQLVVDLGLIAEGSEGLEIANPIYREIIPRALTAVVQSALPVAQGPPTQPDGTLDFKRLLEGFRAFWCEHSEHYLAHQPYSEAAAQLIFMAYLQRVVNGGGFIDREYGVGRGRVDLCLRWPTPRGVARWAIELKVWRDDKPDPLERGKSQLGAYLDRLGLTTGVLVIFDMRSGTAPLPERCTTEVVESDGRTIEVWRF